MLSQDWLKYTELVASQYNRDPKSRLDRLSPDMIHSHVHVLVNEAREKKNVKVFHQPHFQQQIANQKKYEAKTDELQVGDYIYLSSNEKLFDKSFDTQV